MTSLDFPPRARCPSFHRDHEYPKSYAPHKIKICSTLKSHSLRLNMPHINPPHIRPPISRLARLHCNPHHSESAAFHVSVVLNARYPSSRLNTKIKIKFFIRETQMRSRSEHRPTCCGTVYDSRIDMTSPGSTGSTLPTNQCAAAPIGPLTTRRPIGRPNRAATPARSPALRDPP